MKHHSSNGVDILAQSAEKTSRKYGQHAVYYASMASKSVQKAKELPSHIVRQITGLASSGFSLVAALAWNDAIKRFIDEFIKPYVTKGSGVVAQFVYAIAITVLVVLVTLQLGWLQNRLEKKEEGEK